MTTVFPRTAGRADLLGQDLPDLPCRYGFAVSWRQVEPRGTWQVDPDGLAPYDRLVDELVGLGAAPVVMLHHRDVPAPVAARGGWTNRDTAFRFAEFAQAVDRVLGDRVGMWSTLDGPRLTTLAGAGTELTASLTTIHHVLLGHGLAAGALRASRRPGAARCVVVDVDSDAWTAARAPVGTGRGAAPFDHRLLLGPLLAGAYPADLLLATAGATGWGFVRTGDLAAIAQPIDVLAVRPTGGRPGDAVALLSSLRHAYDRVTVMAAQDAAALDGPDTAPTGPRASTCRAAHLALGRALATGMNPRPFLLRAVPATV